MLVEAAVVVVLVEGPGGCRGRGHQAGVLLLGHLGDDPDERAVLVAQALVVVTELLQLLQQAGRAYYRQNVCLRRLTIGSNSKLGSNACTKYAYASAGKGNGLM